MHDRQQMDNRGSNKPRRQLWKGESTWNLHGDCCVDQLPLDKTDFEKYQCGLKEMTYFFNRLLNEIALYKYSYSVEQSEVAKHNRE